MREEVSWILAFLYRISHLTIYHVDPKSATSNKFFSPEFHTATHSAPHNVLSHKSLNMLPRRMRKKRVLPEWWSRLNSGFQRVAPTMSFEKCCETSGCVGWGGR